MLLITSIIYFRKDLSMALGLSSSLLLAYLLLDLLKEKDFLELYSYSIFYCFYILYWWREWSSLMLITKTLVKENL